MARGVNKVTLIGNVGQDPEVKYTQSNMAVTSLSLATTSVRKDRDGNTQEDTQWHRVKFFDKKAEIIGEHVKKGQQLYIEGTLKYGSYEKDGVTHYTTDIIAQDFQFLGGGQQGGQRSQAPARQAPARAPQQRPQAPARPQRQPQGPDFGSDFADDDIPF
jgi:single-strand DNA-binding protein